MADACPCKATVHAFCLAEFLNRGFRPRCPVCFAPFASAARVIASESLYQRLPNTANLLSLASARTANGSPAKALELLKSATPEPSFAIAYMKVHQALRILGRTLDVLFEAEALCGSVFAHALILLH